MVKKILGVLAAGVFAGLLGWCVGFVFDAHEASANPPFPRDNAEADTAPGTPALTSIMACSTVPRAFRYDNFAAGYAVADALPIPDHAVGVIHNSGTVVGTCCWASDAAALVGDQSADATRILLEGAAQGSCFPVPAGDTPFRANYLARQLKPSFYTGVCNAASAHDQAVDYDVYLSCANDADCDDVGGTPASTTCGGRSNLVVPGGSGGQTRVRGEFLVCACASATTLFLHADR